MNLEEMKNPEKFDYYCGVLFAKLYENFPVPIETSDFEELDNDDDCEIIAFSLLWLKENDLISGTPLVNGYMVSVTPTLRGLAMLKMLPSSLDNKKPIGEALVDAVKSKTPDVIADMVKMMFVSGIG